MSCSSQNIALGTYGEKQIQCSCFWRNSVKIATNSKNNRQVYAFVPKVCKVIYEVLCIFADNFSKPAKAEPNGPVEAVTTTQSGSGSAVSNSSGVNSRPVLKKLTIPLKALPAQAPHHKILPGKQPVSAATSTRWVNKGVLKIAIQRGCGSWFCHKLTESDSIPAVEINIKIFLKNVKHTIGHNCRQVIQRVQRGFFGGGGGGGVGHSI